ncbi:hypothetical protein CYLTODRAFT_234704 [Cylindrobasidium torrendii FP15055 ss-10]|uniref:Uncharacterized protein n=1 Tax=Cylindrobasidium torrendii FP15055 ss-10 TaxID=1314674 RepID=A0A0D7ASB5_9AGAR|nr:hypothetical protein CYLTODRAFT_234704 [Cylindrobasidium torrendii FP15055 ss-10]
MSAYVPFPVESAFYYYGLPSKPALVARSGADHWVEPSGPEAYLVAKELHPVGPHMLDSVWETIVCPAIEAYLSRQVAWTSVDPTRIGYAGSNHFPVILWIGVVPGSLVAEQGLAVALGCRKILTDNGILDVHVEIRHSEAILQSLKLYKPVLTANPVAQAVEPFATTLGLPICSADAPHFQGSGGFFFVDAQHPGKVFLVTARHALFPPNFSSNEPYDARLSSQAAKKVLFLGDAALKKSIEAIQSEIGGKQVIISQLEARMQDIEGQDDEDAEQGMLDILRSKEKARKAITALNELLQDVRRDWDSPMADHTIGYVVFSPRLGFSVGTGEDTEDWAVIEVDRARVDNTNFVANCIDLGTSIPVDEFTSKMRSYSNDPTSFKYPGNRLLKFSGTVPDNLGSSNDPAMVIKRGASSGLTIGRLNTLRSLVRFHIEGKPPQRTKATAVFPFTMPNLAPSLNQAIRDPLSSMAWAGSRVFSPAGRERLCCRTARMLRLSTLWSSDYRRMGLGLISFRLLLICEQW